MDEGTHLYPPIWESREGYLPTHIGRTGGMYLPTYPYRENRGGVDTFPYRRAGGKYSHKKEEVVFAT